MFLDDDHFIGILFPFLPISVIRGKKYLVAGNKALYGVRTGAAVISFFAVEPVAILIACIFGYDVSRVSSGSYQVYRCRLGAVEPNHIITYYFNGFNIGPNVCSTFAQFDSTIDRLFDCICIHFCAVMEAYVLTQCELPYRAVIVVRPGGSKIWFHLAGLIVVAGQRFIYILEDAYAVGIFHTWIQCQVGFRSACIV